jgi:hypothetical protein
VKVFVTELPKGEVINPNRFQDGEDWFTQEGLELEFVVRQIANARNRWQEGPRATSTRTYFLNVSLQEVE